ncbi:MAG: 5-formyltetrahydrofolate cyclo-ligase [Lachnospiraceae bacterium]|nr:5-formyltetrahydrofolate cyclo-ligase [Lachnospiraceae bacterium]
MAESDVKALKKTLRKELLARRDALTDAEQERAKVLITERIVGHQWFYLSNVILGFVSYGSEICTLEILEEALKKGKKVYVPKIERDGQSDEGTMEFYSIRNLEELKEGYKGILEPDGSSEKYVYDADEAKETLILVPGVGFDPYRNRMGYGKGFYDRFLADKEELQIRSIGIGHVCQRVDEIPMDENDIKPYQVILV